MKEIEIKERWNEEKNVYEAFGHFVVDTICGILTESVVNALCKIPPTSRVKEEKSLITKALSRGKNYKNPYEDITDKVGARFVVLLSTQIKEVKHAVENCECWEARLDRDFEEQREQNPEVFTYESIHFVVSTMRDYQYNGQYIPKGYQCEIQIRTLMQHAYSELAHDLLYKPQKKVNSKARRACAKAMALIEATDDLFLKVHEEIEMANTPQKEFLSFLSQEYEKITGYRSHKSPLSDLIYDALHDIISTRDLRKDVIDFLEKKNFLAEKIRNNSVHFQLYQEPIILIVLFFLARAKNQLLEKWPLLESELEAPALDVGVSITND